MFTLSTLRSNLSVVLVTLTVLLGGIQPESSFASLYPVYCTSDHVIKASNNLYVSAELGYGGTSYGMLRARATSVGPWEQFRLCNYQDPNGPYYTLQSQANGLYVSAELGWPGADYGMLRARAVAVGPWEKFAPSVINNIVSKANGRFVKIEISYAGTRYGMLRAVNTVLYGGTSVLSIFRLQ